jgi:DNA-binding beta-propeller fold protein YncE
MADCPERRQWRPRVAHSRGIAALCLALMACALLAWPWRAGAQDLRAPVRIALLPSRYVLVTDIRLRAVVEWDTRRNRAVRTIPIEGKPVGVAWAWGLILVGNDSKHAVEVYAPGGNLLYTLGEAGQVERPSDIAVDLRRELVFVSDPKRGRVLVYSRKGALLRTLPAPGEQPLYQPTGLAVDPERGEVLVSDFGQNAWPMEAWLRIYDYQGHYLAGISGDASRDYGFSRPEGLASNGEGQIYLADSLRSQVLVFDRDTLQGVALLGNPGTQPGQLLLPLDVAIDPKSHDLYVTNQRHGTVEVYAGGGVLP